MPTQRSVIIFILFFLCVCLLGSTLFPLYENHIATAPAAGVSPEHEDIDPEARMAHAAFRTLQKPPESPAELESPYTILENSTTTHVRVNGGCGPHFEGECLNVRSEPSTTSEKVAKLRNYTVLAVEQAVAVGSTTWYKISLDEKLHYPERVSTAWYISSEYVEALNLDQTSENTASGPKRIHVDVSDQILTAYQGDTKVMEIRISTGLFDTPTPYGDFTVLRKTPSRYMQGPLQNGRRADPELPIDETHPDYYDLPGVPWNLYFTYDGAVIHGAYWHVNFGQPHSHGCVNLPPQNAEALYAWAEVGTPIHVQR